MSRHSIHLTDDARETIPPGASMSGAINAALIERARRLTALEPIAEHWRREVVDNPALADLPYKIETTEDKSIMMSPASNQHSALQTAIVTLLRAAQADGRAQVEWSVLTAAGVKVPDVVWISAETWQAHGSETPYTVAPEVCIEVMSPSNTRTQLDHKAALYFQSGAAEVWLVQPDGQIIFLFPDGPGQASRGFPRYPGRIEAMP